MTMCWTYTSIVNVQRLTPSKEVELNRPRRRGWQWTGNDLRRPNERKKEQKTKNKTGARSQDGSGMNQIGVPI